VARVEIKVSWEPKRRRIIVDPEVARVYWGRNDVAEWRLDEDGGDTGARITDIEFEGSDRKGCFRTLRSEGGSSERIWEGGDLKQEKGSFKYTLRVAGSDGGGELDPEVVNEEKP
jgi:hypothetical protein